MQRETIYPTDRDHWLQLRTQDITSTESAVLFGLSPYSTPFELWHAKKNQTVASLPPNERMTWGTRLQDVIAHGVIEDRDLCGRQMDEYVRLPEQRIASSFDWRVQAVRSGSAGLTSDSPDDSILEIKNVDGLEFAQNWKETAFGFEAPAHIEMQVQHQLLVSGLRRAMIAALVGGNRVVVLEREYLPDVGRGIINAAADFWRSIDANDPPAPDFRLDYEAVKRVYNYAEPGKLFDAKGNTRVMDLIRRYHACAQNEKIAEMDKKAAAAEILTLVGDAEKILGDDGFTVSCGMVGPAEIPAFTRAGYRNLRVYKKDQK